MAKIVLYNNLKDIDDEKLSAIYHENKIDYPKFFKMDLWAKTGFLLAETLMIYAQLKVDIYKENTSVIFFTNQGSLETDIKFEQTIADPNNRFPSPSLFVYTLPNIITGDIAIRQGFMGETSCYIAEKFMPKQIENIVNDVLDHSENVLVAWLDTINGRPAGIIFLVMRKGTVRMMNFNAENLQYIYNKTF